MRLLFWAFAVIWAVPATAHLTPNSSVELDFARDRVTALVTIPTSEIAYATGRQTMDGATLRGHIRVETPDGKPWAVTLNAVEAAPPNLIARLTLTPPRGEPVRRFILHDDAIIDRLGSHIILVFVRSDFGGGVLQGSAEMLAGLQHGQTDILIDRGPGSGWRGFVAAVRLGMHHIAEGYDHLLFLLALLLPAPLLVRGTRWGGYGGFRPLLRKLIAVVSAFTIGHSITLIGGAFLGWSLPSRPVEVGIALSILISAVHAARPIFAGREALIAAGFGLIHGLAFATVISAFALDPWFKAQAILGFNLGIELVQLGVVLAALPLLVLLGRSAVYARVRPVAAAMTGAIALVWIVQRLG